MLFFEIVQAITKSIFDENFVEVDKSQVKLIIKFILIFYSSILLKILITMFY